MLRRKRYALAVLLVAALSSRVAADPFVPKPGEVAHLDTPTTGRTDGGSDLRLPPGYFLDEPTWSELDKEFKRLQERETRLGAENKSLRKSAAEVSFGWYALGAALAAGFAAGYLLAK